MYTVYSLMSLFLCQTVSSSRELQSTACQSHGSTQLVCTNNEHVILDSIQLINSRPGCCKDSVGCCTYDEGLDKVLETSFLPTSNQALLDWQGIFFKACSFKRSDCIFPRAFPPPWRSDAQVVTYNYRCFTGKDSMSFCENKAIKDRLVMLYHDVQASGNEPGGCQCVAYSDNCDEHVDLDIADVTEYPCSLTLEDDINHCQNYTCGDKHMLSRTAIMTSKGNYITLKYSSTGGIPGRDRIAVTVTGSMGSMINVHCGSSSFGHACTTRTTTAAATTTTTVEPSREIYLKVTALSSNSVTDTHLSSTRTSTDATSNPVTRKPPVTFPNTSSIASTAATLVYSPATPTTTAATPTRVTTTYLSSSKTLSPLSVTNSSTTDSTSASISVSSIIIPSPTTPNISTLITSTNYTTTTTTMTTTTATPTSTSTTTATTATTATPTIIFTTTTTTTTMPTTTTPGTTSIPVTSTTICTTAITFTASPRPTVTASITPTTTKVKPATTTSTFTIAATTNTHNATSRSTTYTTTTTIAPTTKTTTATATTSRPYTETFSTTTFNNIIKSTLPSVTTTIKSTTTLDSTTTSTTKHVSTTTSTTTHVSTTTSTTVHASTTTSTTTHVSTTTPTSTRPHTTTASTRTPHTIPTISSSSLPSTSHDFNSNNSPLSPSNVSPTIYIAVGIASGAVVVMSLAVLTRHFIAKNKMRIRPSYYPSKDVCEKNSRTRFIHRENIFKEKTVVHV